MKAQILSLIALTALLSACALPHKQPVGAGVVIFNPIQGRQDVACKIVRTVHDSEKPPVYVPPMPGTPGKGAYIPAVKSTSTDYALVRLDFDDLKLVKEAFEADGRAPVGYEYLVTLESSDRMQTTCVQLDGEGEWQATISIDAGVDNDGKKWASVGKNVTGSAQAQAIITEAKTR